MVIGGSWGRDLGRAVASNRGGLAYPAHATSLLTISPLVLPRFDLRYIISILSHHWHLRPHRSTRSYGFSGRCAYTAIRTCCRALSYSRLHSKLEPFVSPSGWSSVSGCRMCCLQNQMRYTGRCVPFFVVGDVRYSHLCISLEGIFRNHWTPENFTEMQVLESS